jgi:hypothetical protein
MDETQARYAHRIALLLRSRHAHLADDDRSPAMRGQQGHRIDSWNPVGSKQGP